ncbi:MAG: CBS domain-containing protein [Firmicutes bacterium]|nr:CBS domain-containing protein [Bacillota bacterium]
MKNIAFFLTPKNEVAFLYDDFTLEESLQKMRLYGYTSIPVITRKCKYVGTISEGDFLWYITDNNIRKDEYNDITVKEIDNNEKIQPVRITVGIDEILEKSMNQNFIPVIDDMGTFIGIVTRKEIIGYLQNKED